MNRTAQGKRDVILFSVAAGFVVALMVSWLVVIGLNVILSPISWFGYPLLVDWNTATLLVWIVAARTLWYWESNR